MAEEDIQPLVCDNGTGMVKVIVATWASDSLMKIFLLIIRISVGIK